MQAKRLGAMGLGLVQVSSLSTCWAPLSPLGGGGSGGDAVVLEAGSGEEWVVRRS